MLLSIITVPRYFFGVEGALQRNALASWKKLPERPELILLGREEGIAAAAAEFGAKHSDRIVYNRWNTPTVNSALPLGISLSSNEYIAFVSSDCILGPAFMRAVDEVFYRNPRAIALSCAASGARSHTSVKAIVFHRNTFKQIAPMALGRPGWVDWLFFEATERGLSIVDITERARIHHQPHEHHYSCWGNRARLIDSAEAKFNRSLLEETCPERFQDVLMNRLGKTGAIVQTALSPNAREILKNGLLAFRRGKFRETTILRDEALVLDKEGRSLEALSRVQAGIEITPHYPGIFLVEAICLMNCGRFDEAIQSAQKEVGTPTFGESATALIEVIRQREIDQRAAKISATTATVAQDQNQSSLGHLPPMFADTQTAASVARSILE